LVDNISPDLKVRKQITAKPLYWIESFSQGLHQDKGVYNLMLQEKKEKKKQEKEDEFITRYKNQVKSFKNNISEDLRLTNLITDKFCKNIYNRDKRK
jgi:hypothetical protein